MSNNPSPAQREKELQRQLELQRQAFARGVKYREAHTYQLTNQEINVASCKEYPDPPQPREIWLSSKTKYRVHNGVIETCYAGDWETSGVTAEDVRALYALLVAPNV